MTEGRRQKEPELKAVIDLAAAGKIAESYQRLEQSGRITLIENRQERTAIVASDYLSRTPLERSQTLVLTTTNQERDEITQAIRAGFLADSSLSQKSITVQTLKNKNLDSWSKKQAAYYEIGDIVIFNVDYKNFSKREPYCVTGIDISTDTITLTGFEGKERSSSCKQNQDLRRDTIYGVLKMDNSPPKTVRERYQQPKFLSSSQQLKQVNIAIYGK